MRIVCLNIERAVAQLEKFSDPCSEALIQVLRDHAVDDKEIVIETATGYITTMTFTSTHAVDVEMEVDDTAIVIHEAGGFATATVKATFAADIDGKQIIFDDQKVSQNKENTMNNNTQTQTNASSTVPPVYSQEAVEELMAKMAAMQAAMDAKDTVQPKSTAKAAPSEEDNKLAMAIGKGVLYTAGAVAVGVGGWFAWKKWGSGSSTQA